MKRLIDKFLGLFRRKKKLSDIEKGIARFKVNGFLKDD